MVKHIVLWKVRDDDRKQKNIDNMINILTSLVGEVEGLVSMEMGYNFNTDSEYDVVLYATFKNAAALKYYQNHPEHLKCKQFIASVTTARTAADYFFEEGVKASLPFNEVPDPPKVEPAAPPKPEPVVAAPKAEPAAPPKPEPVVAPKVEPTAPPKPEPVVVPKVEPVAPPKPEPVVASKVEPVAPPKPEPVVAAPKAEPAAQPKPEPVVAALKAEPAAPPKPEPVVVPKVEPVAPPKPEPVVASKVEPVAPPKPEPVVAAPKVEPAAPPKPEKRQWIGAKPINNEPKAEPTVSAAKVPQTSQDPNTWTCPNCGKTMPKYVGTCGCGEPQPFSFDDDPPALRPDPNPAPAPAAPVKPEKKQWFGAKPVANDTAKKPAEPLRNTQTAVPNPNTWTCPKCGKTMPKYVGTCGCGEPQPFSFDDDPPALRPDPNPAPTPAIPAKPEKKQWFGAKPVANDTAKKPAEPVGNTQFKQAAQDPNTWTCPNCGKTMPKYVGTCGCGEPQPFSFDDDPPALRPDPNPAPAPATPAKPEKKQWFGAKPVANDTAKKPAEPVGNTQPVSQDSNTWTCPNCGKTMPKYVGTCGCGEPQPFSFDDDPPALRPDPNPAPAPAAPATKPEKKQWFGAKPVANDTAKKPAEPVGNTQTAVPDPNTWTCPKCGKKMPKYVGTCGCGEPQPFSFDDDPPALRPDPNPAPAPAAPAAKPEKKQWFGAKPVANDTAKKPAEPVGNTQTAVPDPNTWTCPKCGKKMPKYVGTCGCGEPQPFDFDDEPTVSATPAVKPSVPNAPAQTVAPLIREADNLNFPQIKKDEEDTDDDRITDTSQFISAAPSLESYSPQTTADTEKNKPSGFDFIKNDNGDTGKPFGGNSVSENNNAVSNDTAPAAPMRFDDLPPAAPMRFDDAPPAAPMRFDDLPPAAPMRFDDTQPAAAAKPEKKHWFGAKKPKEDNVVRPPENTSSNSSNEGTWTCPNCGKVMPKYVGTCGCGEQQPFDF